MFVLIEGEIDGRLVYYVDLEENGEINQLLTLTPIITEFKYMFDVSVIIISKHFWRFNNEKFELIFQYLTNIGSKIFFISNWNAPNFQIISIDLDDPAEENWTTLIEVWGRLNGFDFFASRIIINEFISSNSFL